MALCTVRGPPSAIYSYYIYTIGLVRWFASRISRILWQSSPYLCRILASLINVTPKYVNRPTWHSTIVTNVTLFPMQGHHYWLLLRMESPVLYELCTESKKKIYSIAVMFAQKNCIQTILFTDRIHTRARARERKSVFH